MDNLEGNKEGDHAGDAGFYCNEFEKAGELDMEVRSSFG